MFIKEIHIYGYGKFEQYSLTNLDTLQVIYGENEAGKSTIMSFIQSVLFGFPLKQQSESRYEPKIHSKYGGRLVMDIPKFGEVTVERVKGKAAGDVTVTLSDGKRGGDELLDEVLSGLDKYTFQSIYSFNIHGLQDVHKLRGEDINKFLFSASAIGSDKIMEIEGLLEKEKEKLYKPNGIKPELNRQLADLKEIEVKLNEAKKKNSTYSKLLKEKEDLIQTIQHLKKEDKSLQNELYEKKEWNRIYPHLMKRKQLVSQIEEWNVGPFPPDGLSRLDKLYAELATIEKRVPLLKKQKEQLEEEISQLPINPRVLQLEEELQQIIEDIPSFKLEESTANELSFQKRQIKDEILFLTTKLGIQEDFSNFKDMDVSFAKKDRITQLVHKQQQLLEKQRNLAKREEEIHEKIFETQHLIDQLHKKKVTPSEKQRLLDVLQRKTERLKYENEYQLIKNQLSHFQSNDRSKQNNNPILGFVLAFLLVGLVVTPLFFELWLLSLGVFVASIMFMILFFVSNRKGRNDSVQVIYKQLQNQKTLLESRLKDIDQSVEEWESAQQLLDQESQIDGQMEIEKIKLSQFEKQHENVIADFESWEGEWRQNEAERVSLGRSLSLNEQMAKNYLLEAFEYLEQLRGKWIEYQTIREKLNTVQKKIAEKEELLVTFENVLPIKGSNYFEKTAYLKSLLISNKDLYQKLQEKRTKLSDIVNQIQSWKEEEHLIQSGLHELLSEAEVNSKEAFIDKVKKGEKRKQLEEQLQLVDEQLLRVSQDLLNRFKGIDFPFPETVFEDIEGNKRQIKQKLEQLESKKAAVQYELNVLEEGGTYSELLHRYHQQKYEFNETAKKWAVYSTARYILDMSMEKYKTEKLPMLLLRASKLFSGITSGKYKRVFTDPSNDHILVENQYGVVFDPEELSQATHEQLYLSIRFALSQQINELLNVPIFIDDGFVHFDEARLGTTLQLLKEMAQSRQVFLFSCHKEVVNSFEKAKTLQLQT